MVVFFLNIKYYMVNDAGKYKSYYEYIKSFCSFSFWFSSNSTKKFLIMKIVRFLLLVVFFIFVKPYLVVLIKNYFSSTAFLVFLQEKFTVFESLGFCFNKPISTSEVIVMLYLNKEGERILQSSRMINMYNPFVAAGFDGIVDFLDYYHEKDPYLFGFVLFGTITGSELYFDNVFKTVSRVITYDSNCRGLWVAGGFVNYCKIYHYIFIRDGDLFELYTGLFLIPVFLICVTGVTGMLLYKLNVYFKKKDGKGVFEQDQRFGDSGLEGASEKSVFNDSVCISSDSVTTAVDVPVSEDFSVLSFFFDVVFNNL